MARKRTARQTAKRQKSSAKTRTSKAKRSRRTPAKRQPSKRMLKASKDVLTGGIYAGDPRAGHIPAGAAGRVSVQKPVLQMGDDVH